jgi:hypothetical protein
VYVVVGIELLLSGKAMRGEVNLQGHVFSDVSPEEWVPADHSPAFDQGLCRWGPLSFALRAPGYRDDCVAAYPNCCSEAPEDLSALLRRAVWRPSLFVFVQYKEFAGLGPFGVA